MQEKYTFQLKFTVRDYECDIQGIVNNAVYQNYLEHTRHEFLKSVGLDFHRLHREGKDAVVTRAELDFGHPLASGDEFVCCLNMAREKRLRFIFQQDIFRLPDEKLILQARIYAVFISEGRPILPPPEVITAIEKIKEA